jgi:hypothetical protein
VATHITTTVVDDFDGSPAAGTHRFAWQDTTYEIDLSDTNLQRLADALAPFITAGRRLPKTSTGTTVGRKSGPAAETVKQMRAWWKTNRHRDDLPAFRASGRIPQQVTDAYRQASTPAQP